MIPVSFKGNFIELVRMVGNELAVQNGDPPPRYHVLSLFHIEEQG